MNKDNNNTLEEKIEIEQKEETVEQPVVEQPKSELEILSEQVEEYKDKWMRSVAEFDNYKKRTARYWQEGFLEGVQSVVSKVFEIGDNLEWALSIGLEEKTAEGIKNLIKKYGDILKEIGIEEINPVGEVFDPNNAEAVMQVEAQEGEESETVKQVFQKGYRLNDKIIRYAKVSVIK